MTSMIPYSDALCHVFCPPHRVWLPKLRSFDTSAVVKTAFSLCFCDCIEKDDWITHY